MTYSVYYTMIAPFVKLLFWISGECGVKLQLLLSVRPLRLEEVEPVRASYICQTDLSINYKYHNICNYKTVRKLCIKISYLTLL